MYAFWGSADYPRGATSVCGQSLLHCQCRLGSCYLNIKPKAHRLTKCRPPDPIFCGRSIGDLDLKGQGVVAEPEVHSLFVGDAEQFLILASDGLWEMVSDEQAVTYVQARQLHLAPACWLHLAQLQHVSGQGSWSEHAAMWIYTLHVWPCHAACCICQPLHPPRCQTFQTPQLSMQLRGFKAPCRPHTPIFQDSDPAGHRQAPRDGCTAPRTGSLHTWIR